MLRKWSQDTLQKKSALDSHCRKEIILMNFSLFYKKQV